MNNDYETVECNLCASKKFKVIYKGISDEKGSPQEKYKSSGSQISSDQIVKCAKCGLMYVNPRLKQEIIVNGYSEGSDETFVSQAKGREITFNKCLKLIEKYRKKGKILDIGTAGGSFLHVAKKRGWEVHGVEPNKWLCKWGKKNYGIDIKQGTIFDNEFKEDYFDVVTLWDVLEHVSDPTKLLNECRRILKKKGILIVNYPDIGSWIARLMRSKWIFLLSVHLYYFTPKTIKATLGKTGFKTLKIKPHFQTLSLGYLAYRMEPYSRFLHKISKKGIALLKLNNFQMPYWLGQTLVIARKK